MSNENSIRYENIRREAEVNEINDQYAAGKIKRKLAFLGQDLEKVFQKKLTSLANAK